MKSASENLDRLIEAIQVPQSKYEDAVTAYQSICRWFERSASTIRDVHRESFLQGSFRLGTAIRPTTDDDDYDLDIAVVFNHSKTQISQAKLKRKLGVEIKSYAAANRMTHPIDARRCWTQDYADGRQFHVDTLPCIPDAGGLRQKLSSRQLTQRFVEDAVAITDKNDDNYNEIHSDWRNSNPKGYAAWFEDCMAASLQQRKLAIAKAENRLATEIPTYRAQTPLQKAVQLLKYHRDVMFADDPDDQPISIIITTLAAKAYRGEDHVEAALVRILMHMEDGIDVVDGDEWVRNPSNEMENFADKWKEHPQRRTNFYSWLEAVRADFTKIAQASEAEVETVFIDVFGSETATRAMRRVDSRSGVKRDSIAASHRLPPEWPERVSGHVKIHRATWSKNGSIRKRTVSSDGSSVPKGVKLKFHAKTDIPKPFDVYWQIVNTGHEAQQNECLRGGFEGGEVQPGRLNRAEPTAYTGTHTVECFIVKDGFLAARSGQFLVNIA